MTKQAYIFLGPPGVGKGTISRLCIDVLGWEQISTGDLCRQHITDGTDIGKQIDFTIKSGKLICDSLIMQMVQSWLQEHQKSDKPVVFDGLPRTLVQAEMLKAVFADMKAIVTVIVFTIDDIIVLHRLMNRVICATKNCRSVYSVLQGEQQPKVAGVCDVCGGCLVRRSDDEEAAIINRLVVYHEATNEIVRYYSNNNTPMYTIDAHQPVLDVFAQLKKTVSR